MYCLLVILFLNELELICLQTFNGFKYSKWLNISIWLIEGTLTGTTSPGQSETVSSGNEGVLHTLGLEPCQQMQFAVISKTLVGGGSYLSAEIQSAYPTASPTNRTKKQTKTLSQTDGTW